MAIQFLIKALHLHLVCFMQRVIKKENVTGAEAKVKLSR
jgi:hypothetical protein